MTDDIVARLRHVTEFWRPEAEDTRLMREAADAIERLTRERDECRSHLRDVIDNLTSACEYCVAAERKLEKLREVLLEIEQCYGREPWQLTKTMKEIARAALKETESEG